MPSTLRSGISNAMTRIKREFYGKGPARARTYIFDNVVFAVLEDVLTPVEVALREGGRGDLVRRTRLTFEAVMRPTFVGEVERLTRARVIAYHSQIVFEPDMAVEIFALDHPVESERARRSEAAGRIRAAIADGIVGVVSEHWGKGPTRARAYVEDQFVFAILEDPLTTVERTLIEGGEPDLVRDLRMAFHELRSTELDRAVEQAAGRSVLTSHSQVVFDPDIVFVIFVLDGEV
jgi:uncharacterized protein YbcI